MGSKKRSEIGKKRDGDQLIREIEHHLHAAEQERGVDALLSRPFEAIRLSADVGRSIDRITPAEWNAFTHSLGVFEMKFAPLIAVINDVCRAAMNGRKRGEISLNGNGGRRKTKVVVTK